MATLKITGIESPLQLINNVSGFPTAFPGKRISSLVSPFKIISTAALNQPTPNSVSVNAIYPLNELSSGPGGDGGTVGFSF